MNVGHKKIPEGNPGNSITIKNCKKMNTVANLEKNNELQTIGDKKVICDVFAVF